MDFSVKEKPGRVGVMTMGAMSLAFIQIVHIMNIGIEKARISAPVLLWLPRLIICVKAK
ncbi:MAG: hypothetical protein ACI8Z9_002283 [Paraglaciecola sp.]|jgi:hypothetical protein